MAKIQSSQIGLYYGGSSGSFYQPSGKKDKLDLNIFRSASPMMQGNSLDSSFALDKEKFLQKDFFAGLVSKAKKELRKGLNFLVNKIADSDSDNGENFGFFSRSGKKVAKYNKKFMNPKLLNYTKQKLSQKQTGVNLDLIL